MREKGWVVDFEGVRKRDRFSLERMVKIFLHIVEPAETETKIIARFSRENECGGRMVIIRRKYPDLEEVKN